MDIVSSAEFNLPPDLRDPNSVLWHLAMVARDHNHQSFHLLQESLNHLSQKARDKSRFDDHEKAFLQVIFTCPWWGGCEHGLNEAKRYLEPGSTATEVADVSVTPISDGVQLALAMMANHYVQGNGQFYPLNLHVYRSSSIVRDTVSALRDYIRELFTFKKSATMVRSSDLGFLHSKYASDIEKKRKNAETKGFIFNDGSLMLDQKDPRLITLGNRFYISAMTSTLGTSLMTRWRIEGTYRFEIFKEGDAETGIPLNDQHILVIPSCLGAYLVDLEIAKPFEYFTDWAESYPLIKI